jgi:hypothetical protein
MDLPLLHVRLGDAGWPDGPKVEADQLDLANVVRQLDLKVNKNGKLFRKLFMQKLPYFYLYHFLLKKR